MSNTVASSVASERWVEATLGELAEYITSGSRDWSKYYADSGAIFIRTQDINRNRLSLNEVAFVKLPEKVEGKRSLVRKGDLLVTITGANVGKVAVVEGEIPEAYVSQSVCLVRLKDPSLAKFVHLQLTAKRGDKTTVEAMAYGLGRPVLNLENIRSAPIRVAPPKAQVLIVAEIEKQFSRLDEAVANLKRVKANLKRYKAAVLKAAVEGQLVSSKLGSWTRTNLGTVLTTIEAGKSFKCEERLPSIREIGVVKVSAVTWGTYNEEESKTCLDPDRIETRYFVKPGDFLFSRANTIQLVGACVIAQKVTRRIMLSDKILRFRFSDEVVPSWVLYWLRSDIGRKEIQRLSTGNQESMRNIGQERIRQITFALPGLEEQHAIVAEVERRLSVIEELETTVEANLTRADRLRQSVLGQAFSGRLPLSNVVGHSVHLATTDRPS